LQQRELFLQIRPAVIHLVQLRLAIARRPAFDDVADVHVVPRELHRDDHPIEQLPCRANKGLPPAVFLLARSFA
jgi:hypothetical protein